jgi:hypothetical protein
MASFLDVCKFNPTAGGTTDWTVSSAVTGYQTPAGAGATNNGTYRYRAESSDLTQWEIGYGVYTTAGTVLTRATVLFNSAGTTAKINFSSAPQVSVVALAEDLVFINPPQGRLTLQTATPVMTTTQSAKTTIFYTPYVGNQVPIYDGVSFRNVAFAELSVATTDTTKSPAAIGASKVNDWFVWDDAGTTRIGHGPDWTSDSARSAGTALVMVNGVLLNNASITNGPAASRGTYVGTTRSNGSSQLDWIFGAAASGGTAAFLGVWNTYNRVIIGTSVTDNGVSYTYSSATVRQARASGGNQITYLSGLAEDGFVYSYATRITTTATASSFSFVGIGLNSATTFVVPSLSVVTTSTTAVDSMASSSGTLGPLLGVQVVSANEQGDATHANTMNVNTAATLTGMFRM